MNLINGWTKEKILDHLEVEFSGKSAYFDDCLNEHVCRYRLADKKCIVGCFIPDNKYKIAMENQAAFEVIDHYKLAHLMPLNSKDMYRWQKIHDRLNAEEPVYKQIQQLIDFIN